MSASALCLGLAIYFASPSGISASDEKNKTPERTSEEVILSRIDQLQGQLDELRVALAALKSSSTPAPAVAAPETAAAVPAPAPVDPQSAPPPHALVRPHAEL